MPAMESCSDRKKLVFSVALKLLWLPIDPGCARFGASPISATFFKAPQRTSGLAPRPGGGRQRDWGSQPPQCLLPGV